MKGHKTYMEMEMKACVAVGTFCWIQAPQYEGTLA
jgi:hypothetical protein